MDIKYYDFTIYNGKKSINTIRFRNKQYVFDKKFRIKSLEDGNEISFPSSTITGKLSVGDAGVADVSCMQYSLDGGNWFNLNVNQSIILNKYDKLYLRYYSNDNSSWSLDTRDSALLKSSKTFSVSGDIKDVSRVVENCHHMFYGTNVVDASNLILSFTTLAYNCYCGMFSGCTSLIAAPELPATTLAESCYKSMFSGCSTLTIAPELPATTLDDYCYTGMFQGCKSLTTAPELPAVELTNYCYATMFDGCTSLTTAPELPATELADKCYQNMFNSCTSLTTAPELPATELADYCYAGMFQYCSSLTTILGLPATTLADNCYQSMFASCKSLTAAPELPTTELANSCYLQMFRHCTSLTTAPELPATTLADSCYRGMFSGCTSLTTAPELPATTLAKWCYQDMFNSCTSLKTAPELPAAMLANYCYSGMFSDCASLTSAPELSATTLAYRCYYQMFYKCALLTASPALPATTLVDSCYNGMFSNCTSLNYIECLATDISATDSTTNWVESVSQNGTFFKHPDMINWTTGVNGIPTGWEVEDYENKYLTFKAEEDNSSVELTRLSTNQTMEYSIDTINWNTLDTSTVVTLPNIDDEIYIRGKLSGNNTISDYTRFNMSGKIAVYGNCNAIWDYENLDAPLKEYCGYNIFNGCSSLTTAPKLPATELAVSCYRSMFYDCTSLTAAPVLPAKELASGCYQSMFLSCTSLKTAPELPATTLAEHCYSNMLYGCSSLTTAPELPATVLAGHCYSGMFLYCSSLTIAPELPATTLANYCYNAMFQYCSSLTTAPELPATELAIGCYKYMFYSCGSLTTAPELPATTLAEGCYQSMFYSCKSLNYIKCLATDISATDCTTDWVEGVTSTGTFVKHPDMNDWTTGVNGIPTGWEVEDAWIKYNMVDLGLSVKWADKNVGASDPEDAGLYFQWGDTVGYTSEQVGVDKVFNIDSYPEYLNTKYNSTDGLTVLESMDDAATVNMGAQYRMPTHTEIIELMNNTTQTFIDLDGNEYSKEQAQNGIIESTKLKGVRFTGSNGNNIFIPAAGYCDESRLYHIGEYGELWSSSLSDYFDESSGYFIFDYDGNVGTIIDDRYHGRPIRGVEFIS